MLLIETYLKPSPKNGIGVYTSQLIQKDRVVLWWNDDFDKVVKGEFVRLFNLQEYFAKYSDYHKDLDEYHVFIDNGRFINHSDDPNVRNRKGDLVAIREIQIGEEILCDYRECCDNARQELDFTPI